MADGLVDAHVHVFPPEIIRDREQYLGKDARFESLYSSPQACMATVEDVLEQMELGGAAASVVFGFCFADIGLCRLQNDYVIQATQRYPGRIAGLACVPVMHAGSAAEVERCVDAGLRGCGELAPDSAGTDELAAMAGVAGCLRDRGLPLMVHASEPVGHQYPGKGRFTPEACLALAAAFPGLKIVLSHMGGGLFVYELMPEVRDTLADVFYDTAALPYLYSPAVYQVAARRPGSTS